MGKIYYLMGKSASGKDHIYENLIQETALDLKPFVLYTTRPIRSGEQDGREYFCTIYSLYAKKERSIQIVPFCL